VNTFTDLLDSQTGTASSAQPLFSTQNIPQPSANLREYCGSLEYKALTLEATAFEQAGDGNRDDHISAAATTEADAEDFKSKKDAALHGSMIQRGFWLSMTWLKCCRF
jgi:uncharacterized Zn finger protein